ncbi:OmpA family protein [Moraxella sp. Tifton1]|uniref:OmpA family protein n=1 Tax=Moraxella oculi TaxID=2940516 RepID=A0ABW8U803_9GAMM|nr:OmpA family protein [Moraxella sp. Tifton1]MCL1623502.1 OmpA family protein [Moraxella sp. Tifton1]
MKLNKIAIAVLATAATAASAGVTVSPLLLGYHYNDEAHDKQREVLRTGKQLNPDHQVKDGVALDSDLWIGAGLGVELTPSTQLQVEYAVSNSDAKASDRSFNLDAANRFDSEQQTISGNFLIGTEQFTGYNANSKFKPYVLIGAGQQKTKIENQAAYVADNANAPYGKIAQGQNVAAGTEVTTSKDTIGNIGLGARYLVNDALALRGEARAIHNFDNKWWEGLALAGVEVTLGGRLAPAAAVIPVIPEPMPEPKPEPKPVITEPVTPVIIEDVVVDVDGDGVPDHVDACVGAPGSQVNNVVDARGCPQQVNVTEQLNIAPRVFFDRDQSVIKAQYRNEVAKVAQAMRAFPNATAIVEGHASKDSNRSSARYNQRLSEARANAVKAMLATEFGIAPNRLSAVGYGFNQPIESNDTEAGRVLNRRVVVKTTGQKVTTVEQTKDMVIR